MKIRHGFSGGVVLNGCQSSMLCHLHAVIKIIWIMTDLQCIWQVLKKIVNLVMLALDVEYVLSCNQLFADETSWFIKGSSF